MKIRDFACDEEIYALVSALEAAAIPVAEFKHTAHIAVGLAYLATAPLPEATERMRQSLRRFVGPHSASAYHETLTVFWMRLLITWPWLVTRTPAPAAGQRGHRELRDKVASRGPVFGRGHCFIFGPRVLGRTGPPPSTF